MRDKPVIIVGAGLAGLACGQQLLQNAVSRVIILEKTQAAGGNSIKASSGINGAGTKHQKTEDSAELFYQDTIRSAKGRGKSELARILSDKSAQSVNWLEENFGVDLSVVAKLGGHSVGRTHRGAGKLPPGFAIISALSKNLDIRTGCKVTDLLMDGGGEVIGVKYETEQKTYDLNGRVVLASGGFSAAQQLLAKYRPDLQQLPTTNGPQTQGEGQTMCANINANLVDMDQIQIHPTGFVDPKDPGNKSKILAGEALRGEGGVLLINGRRFVDELQTRDVVSAKIMEHRPVDPALVLTQQAYDRISHHVDFYLAKGLMQVGTLADLKQQFGWEAVEVPPSDRYYYGVVTPVIHFTMGGVDIDAHGRVLSAADGSVIRNLYAVGEVTGGVHGANRLGGSSLLECVVFGRIVADALVLQ